MAAIMHRYVRHMHAHEMSKLTPTCTACVCVCATQVLFKAMYDHLELVYHTDQASDEQTISKFPTAISRKALRWVRRAGGVAGRHAWRTTRYGALPRGAASSRALCAQLFHVSFAPAGLSE